MLKRLELIGFKSFAERTSFDFAPGITAVVGPNGSGKSNVVDAVRWILGEQSAKSLRGSAMADVIFNGSASRKSLGMAEVTLHFDNRKRELNLDSDEVLLTRRVYRDGQGEYLLNGRDARLKEIKDLFMGSGAGHGAYSVIEQGKVDLLLTASTQERRIIFDEAAGISRFKLKKLETLKKLERVDADLVRVHDVLLELEQQLRTLRLSAAKAQKYQEYQAELKQLRLAVSLREYRLLQARQAEHQKKHDQMVQALGSFSGESDDARERLTEFESQAKRTNDSLDVFLARKSELRERIAALEASMQHDAARLAELEEDRLRSQRQRMELSLSLGSLTREVAAYQEQLARAEVRSANDAERLQQCERQRAEAEERLGEATKNLDQLRNQLIHTVSEEAKAQAELQNCNIQHERLQKEVQRKQQEKQAILKRSSALQSWLSELQGTDTELKQKQTEAQKDLDQLKIMRADLQTRLRQEQPIAEKLRDRLANLAGRVEVLARLDQELAGLNTGVQKILQQREANDEFLRRAIHGMVADLLEVPSEFAQLIDLALGERSMALVATQPEMLPGLVAALRDVPGRVCLLAAGMQQPLVVEPLDSQSPPPLPLAALVESDVPGLASSLLGRAFLVADHTLAARYACQAPSGMFLSPEGVCYTADGTISLGTSKSEAGLLSRKSELRELRQSWQQMSEQLKQQEAYLASLTEAWESLADPLAAAEQRLASVQGEAGTLRERIQEQQRNLQQDADFLLVLDQELAQAEAELRKVATAYVQCQQRYTQMQQSTQQLQAAIAQANDALQKAEAERRSHEQNEGQARELYARTHEQTLALQTQLRMNQEALRVRENDWHALEQELARRANKQQSYLMNQLRAAVELRSHFADLDQLDQALRELHSRQATIEGALHNYRNQIAEYQQQTEAHRSQLHQIELQLQQTMQEMHTVQTRCLEEYEFDLANYDGPEPPTTLHAIEEIEDLKRRLAKLGAVNLESLEELAAVEAREQALRAQFDDLKQGRDALKEIIERINRDSLVLFEQAMKTIRVEFQLLFRKLFNGGQADIILESPENPLESGIEIQAHPPGKQSQRLSLLSGGERALTAVALLLAIFRSKPSPFCILDEIDAAMDEANTQRLADLLAEFSDRSQFIVITHKKRTMAVANVLHGVTMQESGVSRLVAVRFEDWPEEQESAAA